MGGAQAQIVSAAQLSLWARLRDLRPREVDAALWTDRTLVRAWCMRRTLFLLPSEDLAVFVRGSARRAEKDIRWLQGKGMPATVVDALLRAVLEALDEPRTRAELADPVGRALGGRVLFRPGGGWGSRRAVPWVKVRGLALPAGYLLHLAGARGVICSGPNRDGQATFVRAEAWVPGWRDLAVERAEDALLRRYLGAFGPATPADFALWTGMRVADARELWSRAGSRLSPVTVEGWPAWVLREDLSELGTAELDRPVVRLLPYFDSFLLGHEERRHLVGQAHHLRVYRNQGWIAPVLLVDGRIAGTWSHRREAGRLKVEVETFGRASASVRSTLREEAEDLGRFLGRDGADLRVVAS